MKTLSSPMWEDDNRCDQSLKVRDYLHVDPNQTFETLKKWPGQGPAIMAVRDVINGIRPLCLIYGGVGNGKSHILNAASLELFYKKHLYCPVYSFSDILKELWGTIRSKDGPSYAAVLERYCVRKSPLIIDDVGAGVSDSDKSDAVIEEIVVARYADKLPLIMTTNRDLPQLPIRVRSRFEDKSRAYLVNNTAKDYRPHLEAK